MVGDLAQVLWKIYIIRGIFSLQKASCIFEIEIFSLKYQYKAASGHFYKFLKIIV